MSYTPGELMEKNLLQVWNERNPAKRRLVIETLYAKDSTFFEGDDSVSGYDSINDKVGSTLDTIPADFVFHLNGPAMVNHDVGKLLWELGPAGGAAVASGTDIAIFKDGLIASFYVFLNPRLSA